MKKKFEITKIKITSIREGRKYLYVEAVVKGRVERRFLDEE